MQAEQDEWMMRAMGFSQHLPFLLPCCHVASVLKIKERVNVIGVMLSNSIAMTTTLYDTSKQAHIR